MAIRDDYIAGELVTAAAKNEENTALIAAALGLPSFDIPVGWSITNSSTRGASSTADFYFDNHTYNIGAGKIITDRAYKFEGWIAGTWAAGNAGIWWRLGGSVIVGNLWDFPITSNFGGGIKVECTVFGTDVAGASKTVRVVSKLSWDDGLTQKGFHKVEDIAAVPTNGALLFECGGVFRTSNGGNSMIMRQSMIHALAKAAIAS